MSAAASSAGIPSCATGPVKITPSKRLGRALRARQFRAVADEDGGHVAGVAQVPDCFDQVNGAMPRPKRAGEDHDEFSGVARERHRPVSARTESLRVGTPLEFYDPVGLEPGGQDGSAWRHDQVGRAALPVAPPPHRLDEERAVQHALGRAGVVDDWRIHFEDRERSRASRGPHPFAAEVVVALHDDVGPKHAGDGRHPPGPRQPQARAAERGRHLVPVDRAQGEPFCAAPHEHVHLVPQGGQPLGDRLHVHRPAPGPGHGLIDGAVENPHRAGPPGRGPS